MFINTFCCAEWNCYEPWHSAACFGGLTACVLVWPMVQQSCQCPLCRPTYLTRLLQKLWHCIWTTGRPIQIFLWSMLEKSSCFLSDSKIVLCIAKCVSASFNSHNFHKLNQVKINMKSSWNLEFNPWFTFHLFIFILITLSWELSIFCNQSVECDQNYLMQKYPNIVVESFFFQFPINEKLLPM